MFYLSLARLLIGAGPYAQVLFSYLSKRKVPKRERHPATCPYGFPRSSLKMGSLIELADFWNTKFGLEQGIRSSHFCVYCSAASRGLKKTKISASFLFGFLTHRAYDYF